MLVAAAAEADIGVIPYKPLIRNDRFACPNKLSQYLHAGLMVVTNDLPYVKSVIHDAGAGLSYDSSVPSSLAAVINRIVGDRATARPLPAKRAAIRQAIVQLAMSRRDTGSAVPGHVAFDRSAARMGLRSSSPFQSLKSQVA